MNGQTWRQATDPYTLLEYLYPMRGMDSTEPQDRASRLYYLACCRRAWHHLPGVCRVLVQLGERLYHPRKLDHQLCAQVYPLAEELIHAYGSAERINRLAQQLVSLGWGRSDDNLFLQSDYVPEYWNGLAQLTYAPFNAWTPPFRNIPVKYHSVELLREIFPPPEYPYRQGIPRMWQTETIRYLAQKAYDSCDVADFLILADALEEAGCTCSMTLQHLRNGHPHVRGCWVIELLLNAKAARRSSSKRST